MSIDIRVPVLPESVKEAVVASWRKQAGEWVDRDEVLAEIETDKIVLEVVAPRSGTLATVLKKTGEKVTAEEVIGTLQEANEKVAFEKVVEQKEALPLSEQEVLVASPSVRRLMNEHALSSAQIVATGKGGRIQKEDVLKAAKAPEEPRFSEPQRAANTTFVEKAASRFEKRVPMSRIRARIAERLLEVQNTAAILTTFNEINMAEVVKIRNQHKELFEKTHQVRLGFMSFFTIAVCHALQRFPIINASLDSHDIVYHDYYDIGVAVASKRGLVVPVIRNADKLTVADIEKQISLFGQKAKEGNLSLEDMQGGTFTISNGGVFGSLLSTPILNPPQSAILGMHKIEERPVVVKGEVKVCPMMYVALSYDHRLIDGADAVQFLVAVKEYIETPERLLLAL